eukprot:4309873-Pleurochrysis_carterae.AAC.1
MISGKLFAQGISVAASPVEPFTRPEATCAAEPAGYGQKGGQVQRGRGSSAMIGAQRFMNLQAGMLEAGPSLLIISSFPWIGSVFVRPNPAVKAVFVSAATPACASAQNARPGKAIQYYRSAGSGALELHCGVGEHERLLMPSLLE